MVAFLCEYVLLSVPEQTQESIQRFEQQAGLRDAGYTPHKGLTTEETKYHRVAEAVHVRLVLHWLSPWRLCTSWTPIWWHNFWSMLLGLSLNCFLWRLLAHGVKKVTHLYCKVSVSLYSFGTNFFLKSVIFHSHVRLLYLSFQVGTSLHRTWFLAVPLNGALQLTVVTVCPKRTCKLCISDVEVSRWNWACLLLEIKTKVLNQHVSDELSCPQ